MELTQGRLRAALIAGKVPVTDEALRTLSAGLSTIGHGYHIESFVSRRLKSDTELTKELSRLHAACRTIVDVLDADMSGSQQIEAVLSDPWHGSRVPQVLEELRLMSSRLEVALAMAVQDRAIRKRRQSAETWFFLAAHDLFSTLTANPEPGIGGPLHRFTKRCAEMIDPSITVPIGENSFQKRLTAALGRRTGKISVLPKVIFPGK